jgi:excisionase family DNA binding protein
MPKNKSSPSTERGEHRFVRVNKAAAYWDVHPVTIRKMIDDGKIKAYRIGRRLLRVDLAEIETLMAGEGESDRPTPKRASNPLPVSQNGPSSAMGATTPGPDWCRLVGE